MAFDDRTERLIFRNRALLKRAEAVWAKKSEAAIHTAETQDIARHMRRRAIVIREQAAAARAFPAKWRGG